MSWLTTFLTSTIGRKFLVGLTGFVLVGFLLNHIAGNLNIYGEPDAFDNYANWLHSLGKLFVVGRLGIYGAILAHAAAVIWLAMDNRKARGATRYAVAGTKRHDRARTLVSRYMVGSGIVILAFLVVHVTDFGWRHDEIMASPGGLRGALVTELGKPWKAILYVLGSAFIGIHLFHGIQSMFRSVGFQHPKYTGAIAKLGTALSIVLALLFASIPVAVVAGAIKANAEAPQTTAARTGNNPAASQQ